MAGQGNNGITSLGFNQDQDCFTCCLKSGLRVYNVEPLVEKSHYSKEELGEVSLCEMVFRTNWLLVVKARRPCTLMVLDDAARAFKAEVLFKTPIRALRARQDKVAVVLTSSIQVLLLPSLVRVALLRTPVTGRPLCAIATKKNVPHILVAAAHRIGALQILDVTHAARGAHSSSPAVVTCHRNPLVCLAISSNGSKIATASERGTIIRVYDSVTKFLLKELRRGSDYANVYCIRFNTEASLVCCVSDKGTLHVWGFGGHKHVAARPDRIARAHLLPRALCAFGGQNNAIVICEDGTFNKYTFSAEGNCYRSDFDYFLQVGEDDEFLQ